MMRVRGCGRVLHRRRRKIVAEAKVVQGGRFEAVVVHERTLRVSTSSAAVTAATRVPNTPAETAVSTMSMVGAVGAGVTGGMITESMTWMTPLVQSMSAEITVAPSTMIMLPSTVMAISAPLTVATMAPSVASSDMILPGTT